MAKKRMFSLDIIDTDIFLDLPAQAQLLYFHLNLNADDEGFVGRPKKITKILQIDIDNYELLEKNNFIITFASKICVITDWYIHNTIRSDRCTPTNYMEEKKLLKIKENKRYIKNGCHNDNHLTTIWQPSIDKYSIDKYSIVEKSIEKKRRVEGSAEGRDLERREKNRRNIKITPNEEKRNNERRKKSNSTTAEKLTQKGYIQHADYVFLLPAEYEKLVQVYSTVLTENSISAFNFWKIEKYIDNPKNAYKFDDAMKIEKWVMKIVIDIAENQNRTIVKKMKEKENQEKLEKIRKEKLKSDTKKLKDLENEEKILNNFYTTLSDQEKKQIEKDIQIEIERNIYNKQFPQQIRLAVIEKYFQKKDKKT